MPVIGMNGSKGPDYPFPGEACCHEGITGYIGMVVEIYNEPIKKSRRVSSENNNWKKKQKTCAATIDVPKHDSSY